MPFLPLLRTTFLLSTVTLGVTYALYESNPVFRNFVDTIVARIVSAWDELQANLSPEERHRREEAQRREVLIALSARQGGPLSALSDAELRDADVGIDEAATATATDSADADGLRARRRRLWEIAEQNAAELRKGQEGGTVAASSLPSGDRAALRRRITGDDTTNGTDEEEAPLLPPRPQTKSKLEDPASSSASFATASFATAAALSEHEANSSNTQAREIGSDTITGPMNVDTTIADGYDSDGTSTAGSYSHILTPRTDGSALGSGPPSPSLASTVSWAGISEYASDADVDGVSVAETMSIDSALQSESEDAFESDYEVEEVPQPTR